MVTALLYIILLPLAYSVFAKGDINPLSSEFGIVAISFVIFFVLNLWLYAAVLRAVAQVVGKNRGKVKDTLKVSLKRILPFVGASILMGVIIILGLVLLIIPGLIFIVWLYFTQYLVIVEDIGPVPALKKSKSLVKGRFRAVAGRLILMLVYFWLLGMLIAILLFPLAQIVITTLAAPYYALVPYLLYKDLKESKVAEV